MPGIEISALPPTASAQLTDVFPIDQLPGPVTYKLASSQLLSLFQTQGQAFTKTDDANVTMTLGGNPTTALLNAMSATLGWSGQLSPTRGGTGINNGSNTLTLGGNLQTSGAFDSIFTMTAPTNVTFPTSGTLATTAQLPTPSALTKTDDTNVTLTLGGSPATSLVNAASLTLGWSGTLSATRGGTGRASATAYSVICGGTTNTNPQQSVSGVGTSGQILTSNGAASLPTWEDNAGAGFPSGTRMLFQQTAAPTGWTKDTTAAINNGALRTVTGTAGTGGSLDFTTTFTTRATAGTVGGTALSTAQLAAHTHTQTVYSLNIGSGTIPNSARATQSSTATGSAGSGSTHTHTYTGASMNFNVKYYDVIIASKD